MTFPASVARFLIMFHSSADHIRTLQSNPAVTKNRPERGRTSEEGVAVSFSLGSWLISSVSILSPLEMPLEVPLVCGASRGICGSSDVERKNRRSETDELWAGIMYCVLRARRSHIRTVSSPDPVATWYLVISLAHTPGHYLTDPLGAKSIAKISLMCPSNTIAVLPVLVSHTRPIASKPLRSQPSILPSKGTLTPMQSARHRLGKSTHRPLCYALLASSILFALRHPIISMFHRTTLIQGKTRMGGKPHVRLDLYAHSAFLTAYRYSSASLHV